MYTYSIDPKVDELVFHASATIGQLGSPSFLLQVMLHLPSQFVLKIRNHCLKLIISAVRASLVVPSKLVWDCVAVRD